MTTNRIVHLFAGTVILVSLALGVAESPFFVNAWWLAVTAFVGFNLLQSSLTNFCPLEIMLKKLGVPASSCCG